jgi:hypothetical protein
MHALTQSAHDLRSDLGSIAAQPPGALFRSRHARARPAWRSRSDRLTVRPTARSSRGDRFCLRRSARRLLRGGILSTTPDRRVPVVGKGGRACGCGAGSGAVPAPCALDASRLHSARRYVVASGSRTLAQARLPARYHRVAVATWADIGALLRPREVPRLLQSSRVRESTDPVVRVRSVARSDRA